MLEHTNITTSTTSNGRNNHAYQPFDNFLETISAVTSCGVDNDKGIGGYFDPTCTTIQSNPSIESREDIPARSTATTTKTKEKRSFGSLFSFSGFNKGKNEEASGYYHVNNNNNNNNNSRNKNDNTSSMFQYVTNTIMSHKKQERRNPALRYNKIPSGLPSGIRSGLPSGI